MWLPPPQTPKPPPSAVTIITSIDYQIRSLLQKHGEVTPGVVEIVDALLDKRLEYMARAALETIGPLQ